MMEIAIEILDKPGGRAQAGRTYKEDTLGLETVQPMGPDDPWHVPVRISSRYASVDDIKEKLMETHPDLDGKDWAMCWLSAGGVDASWDGGNGHLSKSEVDSLEREHVSDCHAVVRVHSWEVSCNRAEWPEAFGGGPVRITASVLKSLGAALEASLGAMPEDELACALDDAEYGDLSAGKLFTAAMAALSLARRKRGRAAFMYAA